jgi:UDP-2,4-diacetamido-2,4,6-trideoxy-beta-L-altropyranose hydrolase
MRKNIAIRVDASLKIGTGHMMRCLALAAELKHRGATIRFICRHVPAHLEEVIAAAGYEFSSLKTLSSTADEIAESDWLGTSQEVDATDTLNVLMGRSWDWLIVDNYALDAGWETALRAVAKRIFVIDDLANRHHDCDVLLDQNFYSEMESRYVGKVGMQCRLLLGPRYALLREEFRQQGHPLVQRSGQVSNILLFFGGVDRLNYTTLAMEVLADAGHEALSVHVVIGLQHPHAESIKAICAKNDFVCHVQTTRMAELIAAADIVITAGGSACWEYCASGLSMLTVITAENQRQLAIDMDAYGAALLIGDYREFSYERFRAEIIHALDDPAANVARSKKALSLMPDGPYGILSVADVFTAIS